MSTASAIEKFYAFHGLDLVDNGDQYLADCPICTAIGKWSAHKLTGLWDCKVCHESGNPTSFLEALHGEASLAHFPDKSALDVAKKLRKHRLVKSIHADTFGKKPRFPSSLELLATLRADGWGFHPLKQAWTSTVYTPHLKSLETPHPTFYISNLRNYDYTASKPRFYSSPKIEANEKRQHPYVNAAFLNTTAPDRILITEGEWDSLLASHYGGPATWVIGLAGGSSSLDLNALKRVGIMAANGSIPVYLLLDNDDPGQKTADKLAKALRETYNVDLHLLDWSLLESPHPIDGYDLTDYLTDPLQPLDDDNPLDTLLEQTPAFLSLAPSQVAVSHDTPAIPIEPIVPISFPELLEGFSSQGVTVTPTVIEGLWLTGACIASSQSPGVPLWTYLISPPGAGKSLVLESFAAFEEAYFQTSVTKKGFVSGFNAGEDPSLLQQLTDPPRTLVVKDWTTIMDLPQAYRVELGALLREAFDGSINQKFANGAHRVYEGQFGIVAGVTPKIHLIQDADVGARFLKRELPDGSNDNVLAQILCGQAYNIESPEHQHARRTLTRNWLKPILADLKDNPLPPNIEDMELASQLVALAIWIAHGRSVLKRDRTDGAALHRPYAESPNRVGKQLCRLYLYLKAVRPEATTDEVLAMTIKVARDTAWSRKTEAWEVLGIADEPLTSRQVAAQLDLPKTTTTRYLHDLVALKVLESRFIKTTGKIGRKDEVFYISENFQKTTELCIDLFSSVVDN